MLDVIFSVDTEIWCKNWSDIDAGFPEAFRRYVYGPTPDGDYGLPYQLQMLADHGLHGVFFVEPLFSGRFGRDPLSEIVGLIHEAGQETQLHLHTEWVDESREAILPGAPVGKRQYLKQYSRTEQEILIARGKSWPQPAPLRSPLWKTGLRMAEQLAGRMR